MEQHIDERLTVEQLSILCAMVRINFSRCFKKATQLPPADYVQRVKMEAPKQRFGSTDKLINGVMFEAGYNDTKAFRHLFKRIVGMLPAECRNTFKKATL